MNGGGWWSCLPQLRYGTRLSQRLQAYAIVTNADRAIAWAAGI